MTKCTISLLALLSLLTFSDRGLAMELPNIVLIFGDDMGIDSVSAFNERLGLKTPHIDRLATEGMSLMDAHTTSAVCSPSRYGLLTGRYNWRSRLKRGIVGQWERPLIEQDRLTLPEMLRQHGYATTMIGKWHLGFNWPSKSVDRDGKAKYTENLNEIDFAGPIENGPNGRGFDYWFGDDVPNWPPYAWRENNRLIGNITTTSKELGLTSYQGVAQGPAVDGWELEAVLPEYVRRCTQFIHQQANRDKPFFLYFPMPSPHTPIAPDENWKGKSGISDYADFLLETDWAVGKILGALDETRQAENTIVIFTTDNGTSPKANFDELAAKGVHLTAHWRGNKADAYEGGHRVPLIVRWPGVVAGSTRSDEVVSLVDIMATIADVLNHKLPENAAEDSLSLLPILCGQTAEFPLHEAIICHSISGHFAVRKGKWKAIYCRGSGGWSSPKEPEAQQQGLPPIQLYNLESDPKETTNLYSQYPEIVAELTQVLRRYVQEGRSTPGPRQYNHGKQIHWKNVPWDDAPHPSTDNEN